MKHIAVRTLTLFALVAGLMGTSAVAANADDGVPVAKPMCGVCWR